MPALLLTILLFTSNNAANSWLNNKFIITQLLAYDIIKWSCAQPKKIRSPINTKNHVFSYGCTTTCFFEHYYKKI
ncbi:hypothetical protein EDC01DRAFT_640304 [Geopyxis carbonaria]|nr:hypothetical protein EDC01DRAFT_640304 [Geopyxis carbonaria]